MGKKKRPHRRHLPRPSGIQRPLCASNQLKNTQPRLKEGEFLAETGPPPAVKGDEGAVEVDAAIRLADCVDRGAPAVGSEGVGVGLVIISGVRLSVGFGVGLGVTPRVQVATGRVGVVANVCVGGDGDGVAEEDVFGRAAVDELGDGRVQPEGFVEGGGEVGEVCEDGGDCRVCRCGRGCGCGCGSGFGGEACGFDLLPKARLRVL